MEVKWLDKDCNVCDSRLNSWDIRCSKALKYKTPVCEKCIATEYNISVDEVRGIMEHHFSEKPCMGL